MLTRGVGNTFLMNYCLPQIQKILLHILSLQDPESSKIDHMQPCQEAAKITSQPAFFRLMSGLNESH